MWLFFIGWHICIYSVNPHSHLYFYKAVLVCKIYITHKVILSVDIVVFTRYSVYSQHYIIASNVHVKSCALTITRYVSMFLCTCMYVHNVWKYTMLFFCFYRSTSFNSKYCKKQWKINCCTVGCSGWFPYYYLYNNLD